MLNKVKWSTLFAVAGGCGIGLVSMQKIFRTQQEEMLRNADFIKSAVDLAKGHSGIIELLGEDSIEVGQASFQDGWGKMERRRARLTVPLKGSNDVGRIYAYAKKDFDKDRFKLVKVEITFDKIKGKKVILLDKMEDELAKEKEDAQNVGKPKEDNGEMSPEDRRRLQLELMMGHKSKRTVVAKET